MFGRARKHDVFVIGDELSEAETTILEGTPAPLDDQAPGGQSQPSGLGHASPPRRRRVLAVLAIAGPLGAVVGVLVSSLSTSSGPKGDLTSSSRSAQVQGPPPRAAAVPAPLRPPSERRPIESSHGTPAAARRPEDHATKEPEREPIIPEAPRSSPLPVAAPPAPEVPPTQPSPSPPPPPSGGGPGGTEHFGFEH